MSRKTFLLRRSADDSMPTKKPSPVARPDEGAVQGQIEHLDAAELAGLLAALPEETGQRLRHLLGSARFLRVLLEDAESKEAAGLLEHAESEEAACREAAARRGSCAHGRASPRGKK